MKGKVLTNVWMKATQSFYDDGSLFFVAWRFQKQNDLHDVFAVFADQGTRNHSNADAR